MKKAKRMISKKKIIILSSIAILILLTLGAIFYYRFYNSKESIWSRLSAKAQAETGYYSSINGTPRLIAGDFTGFENKKDAEGVAWAFIEQNKILYQIRDPKSELEVSKKIETNNTTNVEFFQSYEGVPVHGAKIIVRVTKELRVDSVFSSYVSNISISTNSKISKEEAIKKAGAESGSETTLVIYAPSAYNKKGENELAWYVKGKQEHFFINAITGAIINSFSTVNTELDRKTYTSNNLDFTWTTLWITENGNEPRLPAGEPDQQGLNAHNYTKATYDYYRSRHGRDGWDGIGSTFNSYVHFRVNSSTVWDNAGFFWDGHKVAFGENWPNALEIVSHEWSHGVTHVSSDLEYEGESGALNESFSDIFGTFSQFYFGTQNWTIGEEKGEPIRDMKNPNSFGDPDNINDKEFFQTNKVCVSINDFCGVHTNSAILNKVAQLLVDGGTNHDIMVPSLGILKTEKLFYHVYTQRLTNVSNFEDMRNETIEASKRGFWDGLGTRVTFNKSERASIINAFASVGIGAEDADYNGVADDVKNPGNGFALVDSGVSSTKIKTKLCGDPNKVDIYALINPYGNESLNRAYIRYKVGGGQWNQNESYVKEKWKDGGVFTNQDWYKFTIDNLTEDGMLYYEIIFIGKDNNQTIIPISKTVIVETCKAQEEANTSAGNNSKENENEKDTGISGTKILPVENKKVDLVTDWSSSGFVTNNGNIGHEMIAGEYSGTAKAFASYDISSFVYGAVSKEIISAKLDISQSQKTGDPFSLGALKISSCQYGAPDPSDFSSQCSFITSIASLKGGLIDITDAVKSLVAGKKYNKFQLRLEFENASSLNKSTDKLIFPTGTTLLKLEYR